MNSKLSLNYILIEIKNSKPDIENAIEVSETRLHIEIENLKSKNNNHKRENQNLK